MSWNRTFRRPFRPHAVVPTGPAPLTRTPEVKMASLNNPSDTSGNLIAASQVTGTNVYNRAGEKLGDVYDVMLDKQTGKVEYAIMSFGGFLGIGDAYHPLPW